jgi:hypothetical protein
VTSDTDSEHSHLSSAHSSQSRAYSRISYCATHFSLERELATNRGEKRTDSILRQGRGSRKFPTTATGVEGAVGVSKARLQSGAVPLDVEDFFRAHLGLAADVEDGRQGSRINWAPAPTLSFSVWTRPGTWTVPTERLKAPSRAYREQMEPLVVPLPPTAMAILRLLRQLAAVGCGWVGRACPQPQPRQGRRALKLCEVVYPQQGGCTRPGGSPRGRGCLLPAAVGQARRERVGYPPLRVHLRCRASGPFRIARGRRHSPWPRSPSR